MNTDTTITEVIINYVRLYGWQFKDKCFINAKNTKVATIVFKGKKYIILDILGNKLLSGNGQIEKSISNVIENYFYAKKLIN